MRFGIVCLYTFCLMLRNETLFLFILPRLEVLFASFIEVHERISRFDCFHNGFLLRFENGRRVGRDRVELNSLEKYDVDCYRLEA